MLTGEYLPLPLQHKIPKSTDLGTGVNPHRAKFRNDFAADKAARAGAPGRTPGIEKALEERAAKQGAIRQKYKADTRAELANMRTVRKPTVADNLLDTFMGPKAMFNLQKTTTNSDFVLSHSLDFPPALNIPAVWC